MRFNSLYLFPLLTFLVPTIALADADSYYLSKEDIAGLSIKHVPELFRYIPGFSVSRIASNRWSVTRTSGVGQFQPNLKVFVDGREINNSVFLGVDWGAIDFRVEDIESLKVITGGQTIYYGSNSNQGVILFDTQAKVDPEKPALKNELTVGGGSENRSFYQINHLNQLFDFYQFQLKAGYIKNDEAEFLDGTKAFDRSNSAGAEVVVGNVPAEANAVWSLAFGGQYGEEINLLASTEVPSSAYLNGQHATFNLNHKEGLVARLFFDRQSRDELNFAATSRKYGIALEYAGFFDSGLKVLFEDGEFAGLGGDFEGISLREDRSTFGASLRKQLSFSETAQLRVGSLLQYKTTGGFDLLPEGELKIVMSPRQYFAVSFNRNVNVQGLLDKDFRSVLADSSAFSFLKSFKEVLHYQLTYGFELAENFQLKLAGYYKELEDYTLTAEDGDLWGGEVSIVWRVFEFIQMQLAFSHQLLESSLGSANDALPENLLTFSYFLDLPNNFGLDGAIRFVDQIESASVGDYTELDLSLSWAAASDLYISIVGNNLLSSSHQEFVDGGFYDSALEVERGVFGRVKYKF